MGNLNEFFRDLGRNAYGLGENIASLGSAAIAEPVAGFAAMYDPTNGAAAIREGMTYTPRTEAGQMYQQGAARTLGAIAQPAMPVIDAWQRGVDIAGGYSPMAGAMLRTVPTAIGVAMGAKPALQAGRQVSNSLGAMQARMIANANAPSTLNTAGFRGQRGAINPSDFNLVTNPDGTVTMYHGTTKDAAQRIIQERKLLSAGEPDVYMTTDPMAGYGDGTTVKFNIDPKHINLDDEFPSGRVDFRMPAAKGWRIQNPELNTPKRPLTEFEQAHLLAQQRAALPVNQGGLGLAPDNTAMDRARAMGFDTDNIMYHGTNKSFESFNPARGGIYFTDDKKLAGKYGKKKIEALLNYGASVEKDAMGGGFNDIENYQFLNDKTRRMRGDSSVVMKNFSDSPNPSVYSEPSTVAAINNPSQIRSPNAAFDPFNRESSNLLAQYGAIAPTATLGAMMYNEQQRKKQGK